MNFLLDLGVNPVPRTPDGKSPLDRASFCGDARRPALREILWPLEYPAAAARMKRLDDLTRP